MALQQIVFGSGPTVIKIVQSLMGSMSAVLMAQVAARAWNRQVGLITGYLIATNWMLTVFDSEMYAESFAIFFQSLSLWLLIRFTPKMTAVAGAGVAFALSAAARANLDAGRLKLTDCLEGLDVAWLEGGALRAVDPEGLALTNVNTEDELDLALTRV